MRFASHSRSLFRWVATRQQVNTHSGNPEGTDPVHRLPGSEYCWRMKSINPSQSDNPSRVGEGFDPVIPGSTPRQPLQPNIVGDSRSAAGSEEPDESSNLSDDERSSEQASSLDEADREEIEKGRTPPM